MHSKVLAADVRRLSQSAARDESELISEKKLPHSTRLAMATSGSTMNSAPSAVRLTRVAMQTRQGFAKPEAASTDSPSGPVTKSMKASASPSPTFPFSAAIG